MTKKKLIFGILLLFIVNLAQADLNTQVEPSIIHTNQPFKLIITLEDIQDNGVPDYAVLQHDFIVIGTERQMSYTAINGRTRIINQWVILLLPKRAGKLTIPAIQIAQQKTPKIQIQVRHDNQQPHAAQTLDHNQEQDSVKFITSIDEKNPFVNQQIIYTVKFYNNRQLLDSEYVPPTVKDAIL